jgi:hypothetical protein
MKWMPEEIHLGSTRHHRHADCVFLAVPVPRTTAVGPDDRDRVRVTQWRGFAHRNAWRRGHGLTIKGAPYPGANTAPEADPDPHAHLSRASHAAPDLLANPNAGSYGNADAWRDSHPDAYPHANTNAWHDPNPKPNNHANTDAPADPYADPNPHADSTANTHADSTTNTNANARAHPNPGTNANPRSSSGWCERIACSG